MLWNATTPVSAVESKGSTVCMIGGAGSLPSKMPRTKSRPDIEAITSQLATPGWSRLVQTKSRKTGSNVDIYLLVADNKALGMALIATEPRELTIVNIVGSIDLDKLRKLEGHFGVPKLDADSAASAPEQKK